jgi:DNA polymerase-3 subunit epsilon
MGRCLSPCLGDLDPNLYRERLDAALALFVGGRDGGAELLAHVEAQMRAASQERAYERAAWLHRRLRRLEKLVTRLGGVLRAAHTGSRLVLAPHPAKDGLFDAFWIVGGRVADWGPCPEDPVEVAARTDVALRRAAPAGLGGWLPAGELDETRIVGAWLAGHEAPELELEPRPGPDRLAAFVAG